MYIGHILCPEVQLASDFSTHTAHITGDKFPSTLIDVPVT